jgi:hypothetical protein
MEATQLYRDLEINKNTILQIIQKNNLNRYEEASKKIDVIFLLRNNSYIKMCPMFLKQLKRLQIDKKELEYIHLLEYSKCEYKYKNDETIYKKRLCKNDLCRYAHSEEELRVPLCVLNMYDCCKKGDNFCKFDHLTDIRLPDIVLYTKQYKNKEGQEVFKIFYYTDCVRIYYYSTGVTSVLHISDEDKEKIYDIIVEEIN